MKTQTAQQTSGNSLTGKKVVILGGSAGIGLATAQAAAAAGAQLVIVSRSIDKVNSALKSLPATATGLTADLSDEEQIKALFAKIGGFDHLVYTAGENLKLSNVADTNMDNARRFFYTRYWGAFTAVKHAAS
ncbi:hypothetical protein GCM10023149_13120 [Mucilaginibacter gynuensis]|uniref:Short subunit dehydrogenase n=1 Tax=Mucilaginibacter gynuensis TaxID=1302236 RepID=A0ABP8G309_9SPHI